MSRNKHEVEAVLIAGPTASGKSRLALEIARATSGVVINADSMQVYDGLRILTARPSDDDLAAAPHRLYGHVPPVEDYSVGQWTRAAAKLIADLRTEGTLPIVCGGTGLYFRALLGGLDPMPDIPDEVRDRWRARMAEEGPRRLHAVLAELDREAAARIGPGDPQRITRALELIETTGRPVGEVQRGRGEATVALETALKIVLSPPRAALRESIGQRFSAMLAAGALGEARAFAAIPGALEGTAGKAIGVAELVGHLAGDLSLAAAEERAVTRSRQYAKRQDTWFRHQLGEDWIRASALSSGEALRLMERVGSGSS